MKKLLLVIAFLLVNINLTLPQGNNLIMDGQFDQYQPIDTNWTNFAGFYIYSDLSGLPSPWEYIPYWNGEWINNQYYNYLPNSGTPDIFKSKSASVDPPQSVLIYPCSGPSGNCAGFQRPSEFLTGNCTYPNDPDNNLAGYAGVGYVFTYDNNNNVKQNSSGVGNVYGEYLAQKLSAPLIRDNIYKFSYKISLADSVYFGTEFNRVPITLKYFGALFTTEQNKISYPGSGNIQFAAPINETHWDGIKVLNSSVLDKKGNYYNNNYNHWMTVEGYFIACDTFRYVYIGHFNSDIRNEISNYICNTDTAYGCFYFIDDVQLIDISNTLSCPQDSTPNCTYNCNYNIVVEQLPVILPSCYEDKCRSQISIQKDSGDCDFDIDFVKVKITGTNIISPDIIYLDSAKRQLWNAYQPVPIYDFYTSDSLDGDQFNVTIKLFKSGLLYSNKSAICIENPGIWFDEESTNFTIDCKCVCESDKGLTKIIFENDSAGCCYDLKIQHFDACDLLVDTIKIEVFRFNENGGTIQIIDNNFFSSISLDSGWTLNSPFYNVNSFKINKNQPKYIAMNAGIVDIGRFCFPNDGHRYKIIINITSQNSSCKSVDYFVQCLPPDYPCCELVEAFVSAGPYLADPVGCCYILSVNIPDSLRCITDEIEIWSEVANKRLSILDSIPTGLSEYRFCVEKTDFGDSTWLPIQIRFKEKDSSDYFCVKLDTLRACEYIPLPCTPDSLGVDWSEPINAYVLLFDCPGTNPPVKCNVEFSFVYRHVKDQNDSSLHRDVQIVRAEGLANCPCQEEVIKEMLEKMWSNSQVITGFELYKEENWRVGDTMCFTNFRVITSDCWIQYTASFGFDSLGNPKTKTISHPCDSFNCCYALYKICYKKNEGGIIEYIDESFEKLYENSPYVQQCEGWDANPPCLHNNCNKWLIDGPAHQIIYTDIQKYSSEKCNVSIAYRRDMTNILNIECEVNGSVSVELVDLMGHSVMNVNFEKNLYSYVMPLPDNLHSGTYLLRIKINNELLFFDKINIIK